MKATLLFAVCLALPFPVMGRDKKQKEDALAPLVAEEAAPILKKYSKDFQEDLAQYRKALESVRQSAAKKGELDEIKAIDAALGGNYVIEFESSSAKSARRTFDSSVRRIALNLRKDLSSAMKKILSRPDGVKDAEAIQATMDALAAAEATGGKGKEETVSVEAEKDWQASGIKVEKGQEIELTCTGRWSPGLTKAVKKQNRQHIWGDADTYKVLVAIDGKKVTSAGTSHTFTVPQDGMLHFRMATYINRARMGDAKGTLKVKVLIKGGVSDQSLAGLLSQTFERAATEPAAATGKEPKSNPDGTAAAASKTAGPVIKQIVLYGNMDWQDSRLTVSKGAEVTIAATGEWSTGLKRKPREDTRRTKKDRIIRGTADRVPMEGRIGTTPVGKGKANWSFTCPVDGSLFLRMHNWDRIEKAGKPEGTLTLKITMTPK